MFIITNILRHSVKHGQVLGSRSRGSFRRQVFKFCLLALWLLFLPAANLADAATYYIDAVNGNDNTGDGSSNNPWQTASRLA